MGKTTTTRGKIHIYMGVIQLFSGDEHVIPVQGMG